MSEQRDELITSGAREVLKEKLRREIVFLNWLERFTYCDVSPLGKELRQSATLHRIALRNVICEICPEWSENGGKAKSRDKG